jgi:hypothetical protein
VIEVFVVFLVDEGLEGFQNGGCFALLGCPDNDLLTALESICLRRERLLERGVVGNPA